MNRLTSPTIESSTNKPLFSTKTQTWLPIREELKLEKGPLTKEGSPTWTIHDPIANRFFRIGWLEFEILSRWGLADSEKIVSSILKTTTINTDISSVEHFFQFLLVNDLLVQSSISSSAYYAKKQKSLRKNLFLKILTNYLYFRIPLVRPDAFLKATLPFTQWIFSFSYFSYFDSWILSCHWSMEPFCKWFRLSYHTQRCCFFYCRPMFFQMLP